MFSRCDSDNESTAPLKAEVIQVLHYAAEANALDESDGVARQEEEQIGICRVCFSVLVSDQQKSKIPHAKSLNLLFSSLISLFGICSFMSLIFCIRIESIKVFFMHD